MTTVAVLGGSSVSTPQFAEALAGWAGRTERRLDLVLVGRSEKKLETTTSACRRVLDQTAGGVAVAVRWSSSVERGLDGADVVLNQVRVGGLQARAFDERFPWELGLPGEETMGPGGFSNATRTLPVVQRLFERCLSVAPDALIVNLTNPAGMVHAVAERVVGCSQVITLCDSPVTLGEKAAAAAGVDVAACEPKYVGMNHFGWLTSLRSGGRDLLPQALHEADSLGAGLGVDARVVRWLRALPNPYLRYVYHPERQLAAQRAKGVTRAEELLSLESEALRVYADPGGDPREMAHRRHAAWYAVCVVPVIAAVFDDAPITMPVGVLNRGHLPFLPDGVMIEVTSEVGRGRPRPCAADELPLDTQALLVGNAAYEHLVVDALLGGDADARVRALAQNPLVPSVEVARSAVEIVDGQPGRAGPA
jgi:6-phospho-beta-glucosidase